ncbi:hypothetical protein QVD17_04127 [Tagetes erecta]|uniref:Uncharacterized protein n=1 Tax=Tagetes erecta TaxID=13708 RepID=A0AAD8L9K9_TARER|nr:hypothetical protein QVD17_04127 [Tagetes erecta]
MWLCYYCFEGVGCYCYCYCYGNGAGSSEYLNLRLDQKMRRLLVFLLTHIVAAADDADAVVAAADTVVVVVVGSLRLVSINFPNPNHGGDDLDHQLVLMMFSMFWRWVWCLVD